MKVHILGCGPAGLLAAHAATQAGHSVTIHSKKKKSPIGGAQFLHCAIPDLTENEADGEVQFKHRGESEGYALKVYGSKDAPTSWASYFGVHPIWNMRAAYNELWERYERAIINRDVRPHDIIAMQEPNNLVISTIPRQALCWKPEEHKFKSQRVFIWYEQGKPKSNLIVYNGQPSIPWYRCSQLFSWESMEWTEEPIGFDTIQLQKPISSNCDCLPGVAKVGRYGRWEKSQLIHHAYRQSVEIIARVEQGVAHGAV